jgi:hypothetical protein
MAHTNTKCTTDHQIIRDWIEKRAGPPHWAYWIEDATDHVAGPLSQSTRV